MAELEKNVWRAMRLAMRFRRISGVLMLAFLLRAGSGNWLAAVYVPLIVLGFAWAAWLITGGIRDLIRLRQRSGRPGAPLPSTSGMQALGSPTHGLLER